MNRAKQIEHHQLASRKPIIPFNSSVKPASETRLISLASNLTSKNINNNNNSTNKSSISNKSNLSNASSTSHSSSTASSRSHSLVNGGSNKFAARTHLGRSNATSNHHIKPANQAPSNKYACQLCELNFYDLDRYNFHLIKIHKIDQRINLLQCYVNGCEEKFKKRMQLVNHLNDVHNLGVVVFTKIVHDLDEFTKWKEKLEKESEFKWIQNNKFYLNNRLRKTFICNRPATNGCKVYSLHGVTTINNHSTFCLSSIKIMENDDGTFYIEFIETHNHDE